MTRVRFPWVKPNERQKKMSNKVRWTKVDDIKFVTGWIWKYLGGPFTVSQSRLQLIPKVCGVSLVEGVLVPQITLRLSNEQS